MAPGWHPYPMVRILVPLGSGILWGSFHQGGPSGILTSVLFVLLLFLGFKRLSSRQVILFGWCWTAWLFLAGWAYVHFSDPLRHPDHINNVTVDFSRDTEWTGSIKNIKLSEDRIRATVSLDPSGPGKVRQTPVQGDVLVYIQKKKDQSSPKPGERIRFKGKPLPIPPALDPVGFNWQWYQKVRGVTHQLFLKPGDWDFVDNNSWSALTYFHNLREKFSHVLDLYLDEPEAVQLAKAVILGDRDEMSDSLNEGYLASGAVHILAVSGLHVGLVAGLVMAILGFLIRTKRLLLLKVSIATVLIWGYIGLTGAADSAVRAGVLFSFVLVGRSLSRHAESLNLLAAAVVLLLLINPWIIHHVGFQLSVLAVAGILFYYPLLFKSWYPGPWITRYFWSPFCVTVAAQLATLMLSLYHFHRFPVYFLLSGIFVVPLSGLFLGAGIGLIAVFFVFPAAAILPGFVLSWTATLMNAFVLGIADLPYASIYNLFPGAFWSLLLPIISGMALFAVLQKHSGSLVMACMLLTSGILYQSFLTLEKNTSSEWFLVKQQDAATKLLIRQGDALAALDFSNMADSTQRKLWPGFGMVWEIPELLNFKYGMIQKEDQFIRLGKDSLSWGSRVTGNYHVFVSDQIPEYPQKGNVQFFLAPDLAWQDKRKINTWAESMQIQVTDLKLTGYVKKALE